MNWHSRYDPETRGTIYTLTLTLPGTEPMKEGERDGACGGEYDCELEPDTGSSVVLIVEKLCVAERRALFTVRLQNEKDSQFDGMDIWAFRMFLAGWYLAVAMKSEVPSTKELDVWFNESRVLVFDEFGNMADKTPYRGDYLIVSSSGGALAEGYPEIRWEISEALCVDDDEAKHLMDNPGYGVPTSDSTRMKNGAWINYWRIRATEAQLVNMQERDPKWTRWLVVDADWKGSDHEW